MNNIELETWFCNMADDYGIGIDDMISFQNDVEELLERKEKEMLDDEIKWLEEFVLGIPSLTPQSLEIQERLQKLKTEGKK